MPAMTLVRDCAELCMVVRGGSPSPRSACTAGAETSLGSAGKLCRIVHLDEVLHNVGERCDFEIGLAGRRSGDFVEDGERGAETNGGRGFSSLSKLTRASIARSAQDWSSSGCRRLPAGLAPSAGRELGIREESA